VRALARSLVRDHHRAEDLVQQTWLTALRRPPTHDANPRGWLGTVLRNLVRQHRRAEGRRARREGSPEAGAEPPDAARPIDEVVARGATFRAIVDEAMQLEEPYRTVILLRFFEDLPPRRIAQRLGVPVSTVHTRLQRGLERLRRRLRGRYGGDPAWLAAVAPLIHPPTPPVLPAAPFLGAALMNTKVQLACVALVVTLGAVVTWQLVEHPDGPLEQPVVAAERTAAQPRTEIGTTAESTATRQELQTAPPRSQPSPAETPSGFEVLGRLVDASATPLVGLRVQFRGDRGGSSPDQGASATTTVDGAFALQEVSGAGRVTIEEPGWTSVYAAVVRPRANSRSHQQALVVAARAMPIGGRTVDAQGLPIAGASVRLILPENFAAGFTQVADFAVPDLPSAVSEATGRFDLAAAPQVPGAQLLTIKPGFAPDRRPLPSTGDSHLEIVLERPATTDGTLLGQVIDRFGTVVADAWVAAGGAATATDASGNFSLDAGDRDAVEQILAIKTGHRAGKAARVDGESWPDFVVIQLGAPPLAIRGRVVDADGTPVTNAKVWAADPTDFGRVEGGRATAEGLARGELTRGGLRRIMEGPDRPDDPRAFFERTPNAMWPWVRTDDAGGFELDGLEDRQYRLRVMVEDSLLRVDTQPLAAGATDVEIRLPADGYHARIAGRVLSIAGHPVAGASVVAMTDAARLAGATVHAQGQRVVHTDADGRFELERMPRTAVYLRVDGDDVVPVEFGRGAEHGISSLAPDVENLEIRVSVRIHAQVHGAPPEAEAIAVLDADDERLPINVFHGDGRRTTQTLELTDGRSVVFAVPETATRLVLLKEGEPMRTVRLQLVPGQVHRIDL